MAENVEIRQGVAAIRSRLRRVRVHYKNVTLGEWTGLIMAALLPVLAILFAMDNLFHLPMLLRIVLWLGMAGGIVYLVRRGAQAMKAGATDEELALRVERAFPELNNELINSLLLAAEAGEEADQLVSAVVREGKQDSAKIDLRRAVPKKKLKMFGGAAAVATAVMVLYAVFSWNYFANAFQRVLVPFMPKEPITLTKIEEVAPGDCGVLSGDNVNVDVTLGGRIKPAEIGYSIGGGEWKVMRMSQDSEHKTAFSHRIRQLTQETVYYVKAGDAKSTKFTITVHERPVLTNVKVHLTYPEYCGLGTAERTKFSFKALEGTIVDISAAASKPLKSALITFSGRDPEPMDMSGEKNVHTRFKLEADSTYKIDLVDKFGFENDPLSHDAEVLIDHPPSIDIIEPADKVLVGENDKVVFDFTAADDYGIKSVVLIQTIPEKRTQREIAVWKPEGKFTKEFPQRYELQVSELQTKPGKTATVYLKAEDWNDVSGPGIGQSMLISISIASRQMASKDDKERTLAATRSLSEIIQLQERNLRNSKALRGKDAPEGGYSPAAPPLKPLVGVQEQVRKLTGAVIGTLRMENPIRGTLESLYSADMIVAVKQLRAIGKDLTGLEEAIKTESDILARLTARKQSLAAGINRKGVQDIFAELDAIIAAEKKIRDTTQGQVDGKPWNNKVQANKQDALSDRLAQFKEKLIRHAGEVARSDGAMAGNFQDAAAEIDSKRIRQDMIRAAAVLEKGLARSALPIEDRIIENLEAIKRMLRESVAESAQATLDRLKKLISKAAKKADKLAKLQQKIKQISEELKPANDLSEDDNEDIKKKLEQMKEMDEKMSEVVEKMAKDLHIFPEIPACNELVQKMREVFEDITQAPGSESAEAVEIAAHRGEQEGMKPLEDALKDMKERMEDMEMWLGEAPDNIKWKQENVDKDEIPKIPLVDLPEELEDLVGDLLDQEEEIDEEAQDTASNVTFGDMPAGWQVMDGPMSNFSAKGKSGNTKPNDMELTGRAGGGREGMANGEMVEGMAKDLEGRETKERRTNDPFQKGEVAEENPDSKAKATGGGKQSGAGGEGGLTGSAPPRNELGMRELERKQMELRRNTEKLYSKAILMYLPTGELDNAILLMQQAGQAAQQHWST